MIICVLLQYTLFKKKNSTFNNFMDKYIGHKIHDENTLWTNYVSGVSENNISKIQKNLRRLTYLGGMNKTTLYIFFLNKK